MNARKVFLLLLVVIEWFALIAQLLLHLQTVPTGTGESLLLFFSYFTILTNILVAVYATVLLLMPEKNASGFFFKPSVQTAIALYIVVVGLIYNIILRQLWDSSGLQAVLHDLLHTLAPLLMLIYCWRWTNARTLRYSHIPGWLVYPAVYAVCVILRGHFAAWYPYPFLDALQLGYSKVAVNSAGLVLVFLVFSFLFAWLGKIKSFPPQLV